MTEIIMTQQNNRKILEIKLNRPEKGNALNQALIHALHQAFTDADQNPHIHLILLKGSGKHFCTGADLEEMQKAELDTQSFSDLLHTLDNLSKPTLALIQGTVAGGGIGLVACCDISLASEHSQFYLSEVKLGLIPAIISPYLIRSLGYQRSKAWALTADKLSAQEAKAWGLIHDCYAENELNIAFHRYQQQLSKHSPKAMESIKQQWLALNPFDDEKYAREAAAKLNEIRRSAEAQEGMQAFLEKRKPRW